MADNREREVPLVDFEDARWKWRSRPLLRRSEGWRGTEPEGDVSGTDFDEDVVAHGAQDLGGSFYFGGSGSENYSEEDRKLSERRVVVWRSLARENSLDVLDLAMDSPLQDCAVRFQLPKNKRLVARGGVQWLEKRGFIVLCICFTDGDAVSLFFRNHPFTPDESRRCFAHNSFLSDKGEGNLLKMMHHAKIGSIGACCWFTDAHGRIHLATGSGTGRSLTTSSTEHSSNTGSGVENIPANNSSSGAPPPITCTVFPDDVSDERVEASSFQLTDTSLTQRLWSGILKRSTGGDSTASRVRVVQLRSLHRQQSENDETFLFAIYSDGKARIWSVSQQACRSEVDLLASVNMESTDRGTNFKKSTRGNVEEAWIETRLGSTEDTFGTKRKLTLAVALRLSSAKPLLLALDGWLAINNINLETAIRQLISTEEYQNLHGFRMVDFAIEQNTHIRSIWWRPMSGQSTMTLKHTLNNSAERSTTSGMDRIIPYDIDRLTLLDADKAQFERQRDVISPDALVKLCVARLNLPGRFSTLDICEGLTSSFGTSAVQKLQAERSSDGRISRESILGLAERLLRVQIFQTMETSTETFLLCERLIDDCEHAWLQGHRPLNLCTIGAQQTLVVRRSGAFAFRTADWSEVALFSLAAADRRIATLARAAQKLAPFIASLEGHISQARTPFALLEFLEKRILAVDTNELIPACMELCSQWEEPEIFFENLQFVITKLVPPPAAASARNVDDIETTNTTTLIMEMHPESQCSALQQALDARCRLATACLVFGLTMTQGLCSLPQSRIFFMHPSAGIFAPQAAKSCVSLMLAQLLGRVRPCSEIRSMYWLRLTFDADTQMATPPRSVENSTSVLAMWVDQKMRMGLKMNQADTLVALLCDIEGEVLPFVDREQQYEILGTLAHFVQQTCSSFVDSDDEPEVVFTGYTRFYHTAGDRERYTSLLQAKAKLWSSTRSNGQNAQSLGFIADDYAMGSAVELLQAGTPVDDTQRTYDYCIMVMKLLEHARDPHHAIEFALRAIRASQVTTRDRGVLCARLFALALEPDVRDYQTALSAARLYPRVAYSNPMDQNNQTEDEGDKYIGQLVSTMVERREVRLLCELPLQCYSEETWRTVVIRTLERKTQEDTALPKTRGELTSFQTLFTFCIHHARYHEAANCMFDLSQRLRQMVTRQHEDWWCLEHAQMLQDALTSCLMALRLIPDGHGTLFFQSGDAKCETLEVEDVEGEFSVVSGATRLLAAWKHRNHSRNRTRLDPAMLVPALLDAGLGDTATDLIVRFKMDATGVIHYLTLKCLHGQQPWNVLQKQLLILDKIHIKNASESHRSGVTVNTYRYHLVVLNTLLQARSDIEIPQWLRASFRSWGNFTKGMNSPDDNVFSRPASKEVARAPAELLRTLIKFQRLQEACILAAELVEDASYLGEETSPIFLPIKTLDILITRCRQRPELRDDVERLTNSLSELASQPFLFTSAF